MRKYFNKSLFLGFTAMLFVATSCDEGDAVVDEVVAGTTRGAALRTVQNISTELPLGNADSRFEIELEMQDAESGSLVESLNVFVAFRDNTVDDGAPDLDVAEKSYTNVPSASFTEGPFGLPRTTFTATLPELLAFTGVAEDDIFGGDQFQVRFEMILTDGRTFTNTNSNPSNLGGSFYNSPFIYFPIITCPATPPTSGDWTFEMTDAYGDGWNGASLLVNVDGEKTNILVDEEEGSASTEIFTVPAGAQSISITYVSGSWDGEVGYTVTSASGNVIFSQTPYTTNPAPGVELIDYCIFNF